VRRSARALARPGEIVVDVQADGDLMFTPSALWTMAHLELPVLVVVNNNRQYRNTVEHGERIARARNRDPGQRHVGAALGPPDIDFAALARSQGVWAEGPVRSPEDLRGALAQALEVVRGGGPALVDVLTAGA
jgi:thiamine pyrophosphate-dependent acetolactate synthase large subunit-like protein